MSNYLNLRGNEGHVAFIMPPFTKEEQDKLIEEQRKETMRRKFGGRGDE